MLVLDPTDHVAVAEPNELPAPAQRRHPSRAHPVHAIHGALKPFGEAPTGEQGFLRVDGAQMAQPLLPSDSNCRERNALILEALDAGWTHAQIAKATGMTRSRVGQLAKR
jgi:hypothetical protein